MLTKTIKRSNTTKAITRSISSAKTNALVKKPIIKLKKALTSFRPLVLTRHPSHAPLRRGLPLLPFRSVVRLGSQTPSDRVRIECNSVASIRNSASKLLMKQCFTNAGVKTADWISGGKVNTAILNWANGKYPVIAKSHHGSRGVGNHKLDTSGALERFLSNNASNGYIFEQFVSMSREYRLHITTDGCFYACRKLLRSDAPDGTWQRHDDVCSWAIESNPSFKRPSNWSLIVSDCIRALNSLGLDIGAFDVMVQGAQDGRERNSPEWIICESCSAPSFGEITTQKYLAEIPKVLKRKHANR